MTCFHSLFFNFEHLDLTKNRQIKTQQAHEYMHQMII